MPFDVNWCYLSLISFGNRAVGSLSGYWVPPPTPYHHSTGEGLWTCAQCGQVSQTDVARVHNSQSKEMMYRIVNIYPLFHFCLSHSLSYSAFHRPWIKDRFMSPDIEAVHRLLLDQKASADSILILTVTAKCVQCTYISFMGKLKGNGDFF